MDFQYDCAGAIICPIQPPRFGINGQRTKARCIGCPHAAFCTTRNDVLARMDEIRQSIKKRNHKRMNGNTIYHVSFGDDDNHYFGSIAAIYDHFTPHELGVSASRLWNYGITEQKPYRNNKVIIRRGVIQRKKTNRKNPNSNGKQ